ncbi:hypothetical protein HHL11_08735 [Ramlibacter sp. G-1-2-2]|uniref:Uncharacterized protein n=1 Tax=Ramlibacter agri TaxID=2728837 RepID=A0A848H2B5_9BURK|nr:hypothetical protein [Ramlibacter agri]NML43832.1 hypothetical protein [Ramlibacter agri]
MRPYLATLSLCALALAAPAARAMEFHTVGDTLVLSGPVDGGDLARLRDHMADAHFKLVLLHESPGGDLFNGYQIANWVRSEHLATAVSGKCESACALIFLGGVERSFSDGRPLGETMVGLHGAFHYETHQPLPELSPRMAYVIKTMTDGKYPPDLLKRTVYPLHPDNLVYAFHPLRFESGPKRGVMECQKQTDGDFKCAMLDGLDAIKIGVVTNPEILALPAEVKDVLQRLDRAP